MDPSDSSERDDEPKRACRQPPIDGSQNRCSAGSDGKRTRILENICVLLESGTKPTRLGEEHFNPQSCRVDLLNSRYDRRCFQRRNPSPTGSFKFYTDFWIH